MINLIKEEAEKTIRFWSLPEVLIITLKRFGNNGRKNQKMIDFPLENLDLRKHVVGYDKNSYVYDLYGICNHRGTSGGHYTAFVKNANGKWYEFNDTTCKEINLEALKTPKHCFFYRKQKSNKIYIYIMNSIDVSPSSGFSHIYNSMNESISHANPLVLVALSAIVIIYFIIFSYLGYSPGYSASQQQSKVKIYRNSNVGFDYILSINKWNTIFFKIDVQTAIKNLFLGKPEIDIEISPEDEVKTSSDKKKSSSIVSQVFNIPGNEYTFEEAKALCKAYGSEIATYNQIEDAYKSGAEWCNYGWSKDQMALFPTQKKTWNKLQKIKGHEHNCGRPGINGGFIKNPNVRFGVNCYGKKPNITEEEQILMDNSTPYPLTESEKKINKLVEKYKKNLDSILVSPFNYDSWNNI